MDSKRECVTVSVRIRSLLCHEASASSCLQIINKDPPVLAVPDRAQTFHFDNIFPEDTNQEKVFDETVKHLVDHVKLGFNCTVFAYGQTGSGKTYTMGTDSRLTKGNDLGIIPRSLDHLFNEGDEVDAYVSFTEIYNEKVFDLLNTTTNKALNVSGFVVQGLSMKNVRDSATAKQLLQLGNKNRHTGETKQNANSSRSHAIFTIHYKSGESFGKLNLVDLAGSESVKKTGSRGSTFQEGISINKGLLSIGQVISALSVKSSFIPYRLSMITSILQDSLNADNYVALIACVSPNQDDITETLQTLDFAQRVKKIKINPEVNHIISKYKGVMLSTNRTPLKRPTASPLHVYSVKKKASQSFLPLINESQEKTQINSISVANSSVNSEITQQVLSPIIRKYITKMEDTLMSRLETVVKKTFQRNEVEENKENTPRVSWSKIQNEVAKIVQTELSQVKTKTIRATSSPISDKDKICRVLSYDSPETTLEVIDPFKIPEVPKRKKQTEPVTYRRSLRLSLKANNNPFEQSSFLMDNSIKNPLDSSDLGSERVGRRVSVRIASRQMICKNCNQSPKPTNNKRRGKVVSSVVTKTPSKTMVERLKKNKKNKDSPLTAHSKHVLLTLNAGSLREIQNLHSVGVKTAEQILLYRQLKGSFNKVEDLAQMPGWGKKKFERFLEINFLKKSS